MQIPKLLPIPKKPPLKHPLAGRAARPLLRLKRNNAVRQLKLVVRQLKHPVESRKNDVNKHFAVMKQL